MTSTSFNVGVDVEAKNSSRVLRPPGGGHTDIFGIKEPIVPEVRKEDNKRNASSILEGTNTKTIDNVNSQITKPEGKSTQESSSNEMEKLPPNQVDQPAQRKRVPPGGFSSGLW